MNTLGDSRFTGRYNLTGGFVRYNPPIISEKLFKIQDGSYVSWNGDIADPQMSITAVETVRTTISEEEKNTRQVNFDISIIIKNSLENLSVSFDLSRTRRPHSAKSVDIAHGRATGFASHEPAHI